MISEKYVNDKNKLKTWKDTEDKNQNAYVTSTFRAFAFFLRVHFNFLSTSLQLPWRWDLFYRRVVSWQKWFLRILHLMWQEVLFSRCNGHQAVALLPALFIYRTVVARQLQKTHVIPAGHCNQAGCYNKTAAQSRGGNENRTVTLGRSGGLLCQKEVEAHCM